MLTVFDIINQKHKGISLRPIQTVSKAPEHILTPEDTVALFTSPELTIQELASEHCYLLCLDTKGHPLGIYFLAKGALTGFETSTRDMLCGALLLNAASAILVHNHPSGDSSPSATDLATTKKAAGAFHICGMQLLDHIIIGDNQHQSLFEQHPNLFAQTK